MIRKASRQRLLQAVETARIYDPAHFIAHLDYSSVIYSHFEEAWLENSLRTWELVLDQTADVPLYLENVFELSPDHHVRVLRGLGDKAGACLDVGHWHCFAQGRKRGNLTEWLAALSVIRHHLSLPPAPAPARQRWPVRRPSWSGRGDYPLEPALDRPDRPGGHGHLRTAHRGCLPGDPELPARSRPEALNRRKSRHDASGRLRFRQVEISGSRNATQITTPALSIATEIVVDIVRTRRQDVLGA
jgi:hypothetical protein